MLVRGPMSLVVPIMRLRNRDYSHQLCALAWLFLKDLPLFGLLWRDLAPMFLWSPPITSSFIEFWLLWICPFLNE